MQELKLKSSASCPWVLAVGGTQININSTVFDPESAFDRSRDEDISGGGFSNIFGLPAYQRDTVKQWFKEHPVGFSSTLFNQSQQSRGYPE
jgi:tripeptidyl-peptidase-1